MPFVNGDRLAALEEAEVQRDQLAREVVDWQQAEGIVDRARSALGEAAMVSAIEEEAETQALVQVTAEERVRLGTELAAQIRATRYEEFAAQVRTDEGLQIMSDLRDLFETDGTLDRLREEARLDLRAKLQEEVFVEERARVDAELSTEEQKELIKAELRPEVAGSAEMERYRASRRSELEDEWRKEVGLEVTEEIDVEEMDREQEFKLAFHSELKEGKNGKAYREKKREELEKEWRDKTDHDVAAEIRDEELQTLLEAKARLAREKLERENRATTLITAFEGKGVDVASLPAETRVEIFLGDIKSFEVDEEYKDRWDNVQTQKVMKPGVACKRKLTLLARDDSMFVVDDDTLLTHNSAYARRSALHRGTVIAIGRQIRHAGVEELEHVVVADVPLYYDEDTSDSDVTDATYGVANIVIDGVSAREVHKVEMV